MARKIFSVVMTQSIIQEKLILAKSKKEAIELAQEMEWNEKEEVDGCDYEAQKISTENAEGRYIETAEGYGRMKNGKIVKE